MTGKVNGTGLMRAGDYAVLTRDTVVEQPILQREFAQRARQCSSEDEARSLIVATLRSNGFGEGLEVLSELFDRVVAAKKAESKG